jgi:hypothetical protein
MKDFVDKMIYLWFYTSTLYIIILLEIIFYRIPYISLFLIIFFLNYKRLTDKQIPPSK